MKSNNKIIFIVAIILLLTIYILSFLSANESLMAFSVLGFAMLMLSYFILQYLKRTKLIKEIKKHDLVRIDARENNKSMIILSIILTINLLYSIKTRYEIYQRETTNPSSNILVFLNSITNNDKLVILGVILAIALIVINLMLVLFNKPIISNDKIIFYDGTVFEIDEIDDIEYVNSYIYKNKKVIKLGKGLIDRKLIIDPKDFNQVKNLLDSKNKS